jgi:hypothetical protein
MTAGKNDNRVSYIPFSLILRRLPHNTDYASSKLFLTLHIRLLYVWTSSCTAEHAALGRKNVFVYFRRLLQ